MIAKMNVVLSMTELSSIAILHQNAARINVLFSVPGTDDYVHGVYHSKS